MTPHRTLLLLLIPAAAIALAGCSTTGEADVDEGVSVVASTNVYGSLAQAIGGDAVTVTSLIVSTAQDPHSFEASARDRLAVEGAELVIENGGGYDPFMDALLDASSSTPIVLNASELSGLEPEDAGAADDDHSDEEQGSAEDDDHAHIEGYNEHVWYDLHAMESVVEAIAAALAELDPANEEVFAANLAAFEADFEVVHDQAAALAAEVDGLQVVITEPVPAYLLAEVGLVNVTPPAFSEAIEEGADVAPRDLQTMLELIDSGTVVMLAYNDQTTNSQTEQVRAAAEAAGIPVVSFTETLPDGLGYVDWMSQNLAAIAAALG